jgi:hypothetical protein
LGRDPGGTLRLSASFLEFNKRSQSFSLMEPSMPRFVVRFVKDVLGGNGRMREISQATVELNARNERVAEQKAKQKFCDMHATHDWSLHADRVNVDSTD